MSLILYVVDFLQNSSEVMALASQKVGAKAPVPNFVRSLVCEKFKKFKRIPNKIGKTENLINYLKLLRKNLYLIDLSIYILFV